MMIFIYPFFTSIFLIFSFSYISTIQNTLDYQSFKNKNFRSVTLPSHKITPILVYIEQIFLNACCHPIL